MNWLHGLGTSLSFWQFLEYVSIWIVFLGVFGEFLAEFAFKRLEHLESPEFSRLAKGSMVILLAGLGIELLATVTSNAIARSESAQMYRMAAFAISDIHRIHSISANVLIDFSKSPFKSGLNSAFILPQQVSLRRQGKGIVDFDCQSKDGIFVPVFEALPTPSSFRGMEWCEVMPLYKIMLSQPLNALDGIDELAVGFGQNVGVPLKARQDFTAALESVKEVNIELYINGIRMNSDAIPVSNLRLENSRTLGDPSGRNLIQFVFDVSSEFRDEMALYDSKRDEHLTMEDLLHLK